MKLAWGLISSPDSLWAQVLCTKYGVDVLNIPPILPTRYGSQLWRSIGSIQCDTLRGIRWCIGNGRKVKFQWDCWATKNKPLLCFATAPIPDDLLSKFVYDFTEDNGNQKWDTFGNLLPNHIILKIAAVQPPAKNKGDDQFFWTALRKGQFSVKLAYEDLSASQHGIKDSAWKLVWKWRGRQAIRTFLWLVMHDRLKTKLEIARRRIPIEYNCNRCGADKETTMHVLRDCFIAKRLQNLFIPVAYRQQFYSLSLREWIVQNLKSTWNLKRGLEWPCVFGVVIWRLVLVQPVPI